MGGLYVGELGVLGMGEVHCSGGVRVGLSPVVVAVRVALKQRFSIIRIFT